MSVFAGVAGRKPFDEQALKRGVASVRHPLTRALLALTFITGLVDAVSYLRLGHVFAANMTGNVVLLGFAIAGSGGLPAASLAAALGSFVLAAVAGGMLVQRVRNRHPALMTVMLGVEAALVGAGAIVAAASSVRAGHASGYVLIVLLAAAMGVRNAIVRRLSVPDLTTTVLTQTLTGLASESRVAGDSGKGTLRRLSAVASMLTGALAGALLLKTSVLLPLALAAALAVLTWAVYIPAAIRLGTGGERAGERRGSAARR